MSTLDDGITKGPSRLFLWMVLLIGILVAVVVGFNITTYKTIADSNKTIDDVTPDRARALMWINIVIIVIVVMGCLWSLYKIIMENAVVRVYKEEAVDYAMNRYQGAKSYLKASPTYGSASPMRRMDSGMRRGPSEIEMSDYGSNPFRG